MEDKDYLLKGSVVKALVIFAIPFLLATLLQALYGAVDLWVVGKFATSAEVSAVATGSQTMNVITQAIVGLTTGSFSSSSWGWGSSRSTTYTAAITTNAIGTKVSKVEYSTNGGATWTTGNSFSSSSEITDFLIRVTDNKDVVRNYEYSNEEVIEK